MMKATTINTFIELLTVINEIFLCKSNSSRKIAIAINIFIELLDENFLRKYNSPRKIATKILNHLKTSTGSTFKEFKQSKKCCLFVKVGWF